MIKCIALDLDRSTLCSDGSLSSANRTAIEKMLDLGIEVIIASGRNIIDLECEVTSIPGIRYAITGNGTSVYDLTCGKRIYTSCISPKAVSQILNVCSPFSPAMEIFCDGSAYISPMLKFEFNDHDENPTETEHLRRTRIHVDDIYAFAEEHISSIESINLVFESAEQKYSFWEYIKDKISGIYITSSYFALLEISAAGNGKKARLNSLMEELGILPSETAAIGDNDNDAEMLEFVKYGIAVSNGTSRALKAADYVTTSNDDDGLACACQNYLKLY